MSLGCYVYEVKNYFQICNPGIKILGFLLISCIFAGLAQRKSVSPTKRRSRFQNSHPVQVS